MRALVDKVFRVEMLHRTARLRQTEDMPLDLAHHMHLAGLAVKAQGEFLLAVDEL